MARDVEFDVTANDKTEPGLNKTEENYRRSQEKMTRDLEREQKKREAAVRKTQQEQDRIRKKAESDQKKQEGEIRKTLGGLTNLITAISPKLAASLAKTFSGAAEAGGPLLLAGITAAVLVGAPLIGATISAAIIGGAGLGGVIGGLLLAAKDARVKTAATDMSNRLKERLTLAGGAFVQPAIDGIHTIENAIDSINLEGILKDSARFVAPLAAGVATAITAIGGGIEDLVHNAGPVIKELGIGIANLGTVIGQGFSSLSDNSEASAGALRIVLFTVNATIGAVFILVNELTEMYGILQKIGGTGVLDLVAFSAVSAIGPARQAGQAMSEVVQQAIGVSVQSKAAANGLQSLQEQLDATTSAARSLFGASTSAGEAIDRVTQAAKENGRTLDSGTAKGRANREAVANLAEALQRQTDAYREVNGAGAKADAVAQVNRATFIRLATSLTGSASRARELANQLLGIPAKKDTKVNANTHDAQARLQALREQLAAIRSKTVSVTITARNVTGSKLSSSALNAALRKNFDINQSWATSGGGQSRTGGPAPINVNNNLDVTVRPDLSGIRSAWRVDVKDADRRQQYKARVGAR